jgi:hypothetical protein
LLEFLEERSLAYIVVARLTQYVKREVTRIVNWRELDENYVNHPWAFLFMAILTLMFGVGKVDARTNTAVKSRESFLNLWMIAYFVTLSTLTGSDR